LLQRHVPEARDILRHLLAERLECAPVNIDDAREYRFAGRGNYRALLTGDACPTSRGGPNGMRPAETLRKAPTPHAGDVEVETAVRHPRCLTV